MNDSIEKSAPRTKMLRFLRALRFYMVMPVAFLVLLVETPIREIHRAWRNMGIRRQYRHNIRLYAEVWKEGPDERQP